MNQLIGILWIGLVLAVPPAYAHSFQPEADGDADNDEQYASTDAEDLADNMVQQMQGPSIPAGPLLVQQPGASPAPASTEPTESGATVDATNAKQAAKVARRAAKVANKVAKHSIKVTGHAKKALAHALGALHDARVESTGLKKGQKESLKKAEAHLREATKK